MKSIATGSQVTGTVFFPKKKNWGYKKNQHKAIEANEAKQCCVVYLELRPAAGSVGRRLLLLVFVVVAWARMGGAVKRSSSQKRTNLFQLTKQSVSNNQIISSGTFILQNIFVLINYLYNNPLQHVQTNEREQKRRSRQLLL